MENDPRRLGIMGGMFDPVHAGHLNAARLAREFCKLDCVLLMPCGNPVHREASATPCRNRSAMLQLIADEEAWLQVDTRECDNPGVSRTWDSVNGIRKDHPGSVLFLIIGMDSLLAFASWYRWKELLDLVNLVVVARPGYTPDFQDRDRELQLQIEQRRVAAEKAGNLAGTGNIVLLDEQVIAVSSTGLRAGLSQSADVTMQLHPAVQKYIEKHGLYRRAE